MAMHEGAARERRPFFVAGCAGLALLGFAGNSLLCRAALRDGGMDPAGFTALRIGSAALVLGLLVALRPGAARGIAALRGGGSWGGAWALFAYAVAFSYAYIALGAATGALLLFGAVQVTMVAAGLRGGERLRAPQWGGVALACAGLLLLLWPGLAAPPPLAAALMLAAGVAWGRYSLRGRGSRDPLADTAGNFLRAAPFALVLLLAAPAFAPLHADRAGVLAALASGALASGLGYALWYAALPALRASSAAVLQLAVPVLVALGGIVLLGEAPTWRWAGASLAILGGIALVLRAPRAR